jgi:hypothetical protein
VLVQDNLNTHPPASLYEASPPAEAQRQATKRESPSTPEHGGWLNIAGLAPGPEGSARGAPCAPTMRLRTVPRGRTTAGGAMPLAGEYAAERL